MKSNILKGGKKMKKEMEERLFKKYPKIFPGGRTVNPRESLMNYGIGVGDGWFDLIDVLCSDIQTYIDKDKDKPVVALQVKEKLGGMRFYTNVAPKPVNELIHEAENQSFSICETCGKDGKLDQTGWWKVLCEKCLKVRNENLLHK